MPGVCGEKEVGIVKRNRKEAIKRVIRNFCICIVIVCVTIVIDYLIQRAIYLNKYEVFEDNFAHVFQIDDIEQKDDELVLTGWVFKLEIDSVEDDFEVILYDYNNDKGYYMDITDVIREDVNEYFLCEYDYSKSGFVASIHSDKLDLDKKNYEVLIRPKDVRKAYKTGTYISNGKMMFAEPESFVAPDVEETGLVEIVNNGVLRVYRPDVGMYVYQYDGKLYWIADEGYEFEDDGSTYVQYLLWTTQEDRLPRELNNWYQGSMGFYFENGELSDINTGKYRVAVAPLQTEYSVTRTITGYYVNEWLWRQYFRIWYEFDY